MLRKQETVLDEELTDTEGTECKASERRVEGTEAELASSKGRAKDKTERKRRGVGDRGGGGRLGGNSSTAQMWMVSGSADSTRVGVTEPSSDTAADEEIEAETMVT